MPPAKLAEAAIDANPLAMLLSNKESATSNRKKTLDKINETSKASKEFSAANSPEKSPAHFDDSRFNEHHLNAQRIASRPVHDRPITSPTELMDLVLDTPPKLRSVPSPAPAVESINGELPETETAVAKTGTKTEPKGNLIDFDIFAEPVPLTKPSRFVR